MAGLQVEYEYSHKPLGEGGFGCVYPGVRVRDGKEVAVKILAEHEILRFASLRGDRVPTEVVMLERVASPTFGGVIRMLDYYKRRNRWFIVMEKPKASLDLFEYISEKVFLDEPTARNFMTQVTEAIRHCRSRGIIHMDIKEENLLLDLETGELKLIDFGSAAYVGDAAHTPFCGTRHCSPPEIITEGHSPRAECVEVWTLGVLLYGMVHGKTPFESDGEIVQAQASFKDELSDACKDLISRCLRVKPEERITLEQIVGHPWMAKAEPEPQDDQD